MFTSTCTKCCHMCKASGHTGPVSYLGHPSSTLFCWRKKVSYPHPGTGRGGLGWDQCCCHHCNPELSKLDLYHAVYLKTMKFLVGFMSHVFFFYFCCTSSYEKTSICLKIIHYEFCEILLTVFILPSALQQCFIVCVEGIRHHGT